MTKEDCVKFFNKVKGKKIYWSGWTKDTYCIPAILSSNPNVFYDTNGNTWYIEYGIGSNYWSFFKETPKSHLPDFL